MKFLCAHAAAETHLREHIASQHPYMESILAMNPDDASKLLGDLISKASGVFLWVVPACRSLLGGFTAYDHISDLQTRVDELPPELEDLFQPVMRMDWIWMDLGPDPYPSPNLLAKIHPYP